MYFLFFLGTLFAAVTLITSSPAGHDFYPRQLSNKGNPRQYCGISIEKGGCPANYPCKPEINLFTGNLQERCPCYSFCYYGYQICSNGLEQYLAYQYCFTDNNIASGCESYCKQHCSEIDNDDGDIWMPACNDFKYPFRAPKKPLPKPLSEIPNDVTQIASGSIQLDQFPPPLPIQPIQSFALSLGGGSTVPIQSASDLGNDVRSSDYYEFSGWRAPTDGSDVPQVLASNIFDAPSSDLDDFGIW